MDNAVNDQLSRHLTHQADINTDLIHQVAALEHQHLIFQRGVSEKQSQLRQALQIADTARAEAADLRRKFLSLQVRLF